MLIESASSVSITGFVLADPGMSLTLFVRHIYKAAKKYFHSCLRLHCKSLSEKFFSSLMLTLHTPIDFSRPSEGTPHLTPFLPLSGYYMRVRSTPMTIFLMVGQPTLNPLLLLMTLLSQRSILRLSNHTTTVYPCLQMNQT